jgi:hypothetical protein
MLLIKPKWIRFCLVFLLAKEWQSEKIICNSLELILVSCRFNVGANFLLVIAGGRRSREFHEIVNQSFRACRWVAWLRL